VALATDTLQVETRVTHAVMPVLLLGLLDAGGLSFDARAPAFGFNGLMSRWRQS
jgi:hypothetical protein